MQRLVLLLTLLCLHALADKAQGQMPIIAYMGVPNDRQEERFYKDFSDCGFNVSLYGYASLQQLLSACNMAQKYGVRILGHCPETHQSPEVAASMLKGHPGFFGYVLQDEPSASEIKQLQKEIVRLKAVDSLHCFYINLHPYYADWTLQHTKTETYGEYLDAAVATSCQQLSFDFYPVTYDGLRDNWYSNLEAVRRKSRQAGLPFWGFVLSVPHAVYPQPTLAALRLQVYSNLAYGAQAIQYFTYWTPKPEKENDFHNGPVDNQGFKTKTYRLVQRMNSELRIVSRLFYGAQVVSVNHLGTVAEGTTKLTTMPMNLSQLRIKSRRGAVVSQLVKDGHRYLAIVNKDYERKMTVELTARNDTPRYVDKQLQEEQLKRSYTVQAGDLLLFRLN